MSDNDEDVDHNTRMLKSGLLGCLDEESHYSVPLKLGIQKRKSQSKLRII